MKNVNAKGFDKDRKQSCSSYFKKQDRGKKDARDDNQYTVPSGPKCFGCQGFGHMKQECPTYLKTIGKSKALATTLSDTEPEDDSDDNDNERILNVFTATVDPTDGSSETVDDEEDLVDSKFEKMDNQDDIHTAYEKLYKVSEKHEKLYRLATKKLSDVELDREELSTKFDEANQIIGALQFEKKFWLKRPRRLKRSCFKLELNWRGLPVQNLMRCLTFKNLLLIELAWGVISLPLILLLLVLLCLFHLLIMLFLRTMMWKLF